MADLITILVLGLASVGVLYWLFHGQIDAAGEKEAREKAERKIKELEAQKLAQEKARREDEKKNAQNTHDAPTAGGLLTRSLDDPPGN